MKVFIFICCKCGGVSYTRGNKNRFKCRNCKATLYGKDIKEIPHFKDKIDFKEYHNIKQHFRNQLNN